MMDAAGIQGMAQGGDDGLLPDKIVKMLGSPAAGQREIGAHAALKYRVATPISRTPAPGSPAAAAPFRA